MIEANENTFSNQPGYQLVVEQNELPSLVQRWLQKRVVAIDTEFMRTSTYFAKPGLIQIADDDAVYIIDPVEVTDLRPLAELLASDNTIKVMHSMSEDIELLFYATGVKAEAVFDTQVAAAFLGYGPSLGYQPLVLEVLGIELDKSETRSDWLKRPLTASQLEYAAKDAEYLLLVFHKLESELKLKNFLTAVYDEVAFTIAQAMEVWTEPENAYLKLRGGWELSTESQKLLKCLVMWRDELAIEQNIPKPWIFNDNLLIKIVEEKPINPNQLKNLKGMQFKSLRQFGELLMQQLAAFEGGADETDGFILIDKPVKGLEQDLFKKLKKVITDVAAQSGIAAQLLGSRKMLEQFVIHSYRHRRPQLPSAYQGWRKDFVGNEILAVIHAVISVETGLKEKK